jgi:small subunit ribosomal protein S16
MAVKIRLARFGAKKRPFYRIVIADARAPRDGRFIEKIGHYNPMLSENRVAVKVDRLKYWLSVGAQATDRILWFIKKGLISLDAKE